MKKTAILILLILLVFSCVKSDRQKLIGTWIQVESQNKITFNKDGTSSSTIDKALYHWELSKDVPRLLSVFDSEGNEQYSYVITFISDDDINLTLDWRENNLQRVK